MPCSCSTKPAGHGARAPVVPPNLTLVPLPPCSPKLSPIERLWAYLRERHPSHRLLDDHNGVVDACCAAWTGLAQELGRIQPPMAARPELISGLT